MMVIEDSELGLTEDSSNIRRDTSNSLRKIELGSIFDHESDNGKVLSKVKDYNTESPTLFSPINMPSSLPSGLNSVSNVSPIPDGMVYTCIICILYIMYAYIYYLYVYDFCIHAYELCTYINVCIYIYIYIYIYIHIYVYTFIGIIAHDKNDSLNDLVVVRSRSGSPADTSPSYPFGHNRCYICIFYYLYIDSLMPLAGLHFCVGLDFVTPLL
jgi:hypothetical protein